MVFYHTHCIHLKDNRTKPFSIEYISIDFEKNTFLIAILQGIIIPAEHDFKCSTDLFFFFFIAKQWLLMENSLNINPIVVPSFHNFSLQY